jgi:Flp pilus assembly protein TadG
MAAVELALVLPLFLVMVFGMVEFSLMLYDKAVITNASREAARAGIVASSPKLTMGQIQMVATNYCNTSLISLGAAAIPTVTVTGAGVGYGTALSVTVSFVYTSSGVLSFFGLFNSTLNLTATSVMNHE